MCLLVCYIDNVLIDIVDVIFFSFQVSQMETQWSKMLPYLHWVSTLNSCR